MWLFNLLCNNYFISLIKFKKMKAVLLFALLAITFSADPE